MIKVFVNGYGKIGKQANVAVYIEDDFNNSHQRLIPLMTKSAFNAELIGMKYAMQAVKNKDVSLQILTMLPYLSASLSKDEDGNWPKNKKANELLDEIRDIVDEFDNFECLYDKESKVMTEVRTLAKSIDRS